MHNTTRRPGPITRMWRISAVRYLVTGGFCFVVDIALLWFGHNILGMPLALATPVAFLLSFFVTYTLQRTIAFNADNGIAPSVIRYSALVLLNTLATTGIVWIFATLGSPWIVGKVAAVTATTIWNYFIYRYWVFTPNKEQRSDV